MVFRDTGWDMEYQETTKAYQFTQEVGAFEKHQDVQCTCSLPPVTPLFPQPRTNWILNIYSYS